MATNYEIEFMAVVREIGQALGIEKLMDTIKELKLDFTGVKKIELDDLINLVKSLKEADEQLNKLTENSEFKEYANKYKQEWDDFKRGLGKMQSLILLEKIKVTKDCSSVISLLIGALNQKIKSVNKILEANINPGQVKQESPAPQPPTPPPLPQQVGGAMDEMYKEKYLKYKIKYLKLKQSRGL
jgi:hypothetical protein